MDKINKRVINELLKQEKYLLEDVMKYSTPKIEGDLTYGKMIWRGIRKITSADKHTLQTWVEQRGERISPIYTIKLLRFPWTLFKAKGTKIIRKDEFDLEY